MTIEPLIYKTIEILANLLSNQLLLPIEQVLLNFYINIHQFVETSFIELTSTDILITNTTFHLL